MSKIRDFLVLERERIISLILCCGCLVSAFYLLFKTEKVGGGGAYGLMLFILPLLSFIFIWFPEYIVENKKLNRILCFSQESPDTDSIRKRGWIWLWLQVFYYIFYFTYILFFGK
ncbi:hypothetical protein D4Q80_00600 [bacterium]|nr:MAG: hypothetical protein D4Q80_00600 [bacterium]